MFHQCCHGQLVWLLCAGIKDWLWEQRTWCVPGPVHNTLRRTGKQARCLSLETFWRNQTRPGGKNSHPSYTLNMPAWRKALHFQNDSTLPQWPTTEQGGTADEWQGDTKVIFDAGVGHRPVVLCHSHCEDNVQWLEGERHWKKRWSVLTIKASGRKCQEETINQWIRKKRNKWTCCSPSVFCTSTWGQKEEGVSFVCNFWS